MSRAQAQFLRLYTATGDTRDRWQSYWATRIDWDSQSWDYLAFQADGFVEGDSGSEQSISVTLPATRRAVLSCERAMDDGWLAELKIYRFDDEFALAGPPGELTLVSQFNGQVVGGSATVTSFTLQLGSALSPVGATVPQRVLTSSLMGAGCKL